MTRSAAIVFCPVGLALGLGLLSVAASAQTDSDVALQLFEVGQMFANERRYDAACPKFEESYKLDPKPMTLYALADCWKYTGRTAAAWTAFMGVADIASRAGRKDLELRARGRAGELEGKLSFMVLEVKSEDEGLRITADRSPVNRANWGKPFPVDPGTHTIEAKAPSKRPWKIVVEVPPDLQTMTVTVPPLQSEFAQAAPTRPVAPPKAGPAQAQLGRDSRAIEMGVVMSGVGLGVLAVGAVSGLRFVSKKDEANDKCPTMAACAPQDVVAYNFAMADARSARKLAVLGLGVGGSALLGGLILLIAAPRSAETGVSVAPSVGPTAVGATIGGRW